MKLFLPLLLLILAIPARAETVLNCSEGSLEFSDLEISKTADSLVLKFTSDNGKLLQGLFPGQALTHDAALELTFPLHHKGRERCYFSAKDGRVLTCFGGFSGEFPGNAGLITGSARAKSGEVLHSTDLSQINGTLRTTKVATLHPAGAVEKIVVHVELEKKGDARVLDLEREFCFTYP